MSKYEAEIPPPAAQSRCDKKRQHPNAMLSRRPTSYHFDYTVVLHSHPSAIKTFISLNCNQYSRSSPIRQGLLSIFYQNRCAFLCNYMSFVLFSRQFSYKLIPCSRQLLLADFGTDLLTPIEPHGNACFHCKYSPNLQKGRGDRYPSPRPFTDFRLLYCRLPDARAVLSKYGCQNTSENLTGNYLPDSDRQHHQRNRQQHAVCIAQYERYDADICDYRRQRCDPVLLIPQFPRKYCSEQRRKAAENDIRKHRAS